MDFVGNGAAKISEGFADIWRVVVGFIGILGSSWQNGAFRVCAINSRGLVIENLRYLEKLLVNLLQSVNALFKLGVV